MQNTSDSIQRTRVKRLSEAYGDRDTCALWERERACKSDSNDPKGSTNSKKVGRKGVSIRKTIFVEYEYNAF